jgi:hypothetical protein
MGCVLVGLLFAVNWIWPAEHEAPAAQAVPAESPPEQTIRIQSARRWPEKIVFDTNQPTIVPPPGPALASPPPPAPPVVAANNSPLEARAQLKPAPAPAKRHARVRRPASRPDDPWHDPWHDPWRHPNAFASAGPMVPSWSFGRW